MQTKKLLILLLGFIFVLIPSYHLGLWIYVFESNPGLGQLEKVEIYLSHFTFFFTNSAKTGTFIDLIMCVFGIVLNIINSKDNNKIIKYLCKIFVIIGETI